MQNPENPNPYGGPNNPYAGYNPYVAQPPEGQQMFGGPVTQDERNMAMLAHLLQIFTGREDAVRANQSVDLKQQREERREVNSGQRA